MIKVVFMIIAHLICQIMATYHAAWLAVLWWWPQLEGVASSDYKVGIQLLLFLVWAIATQMVEPDPAEREELMRVLDDIRSKT